MCTGQNDSQRVMTRNLVCGPSLLDFNDVGLRKHAIESSVLRTLYCVKASNELNSLAPLLRCIKSFRLEISSNTST